MEGTGANLALDVDVDGSVRYWGDGVKLIYRHYATLYFVFAVDQQESDLGILDLIQGTLSACLHVCVCVSGCGELTNRAAAVFVETLDKIFENVCELDLIFHSDKVHYALDEIVMGGMVLETNINEILTAVNEMNRLDSLSSKRSLPGAMKK
jgi:AP-3 complex subunit sigma